MRKIFCSLFVFLAAFTGLTAPGDVRAAGISIDAGLTPAENRVIFRSQMRLMQRGDDPTPADREMEMYMFPLVLAYGVRSDLTLMVRQAFMKHTMTMMSSSSDLSGAGDLLFLAKYRLSRINTSAYTIGIAPTLGIELPTGKDGFGSDTYDLRLGLFVSGRMRSLGVDLNLAYAWNGMATKGDGSLDPGDEFAVESAAAYQFGLGGEANLALAPVLELSYQKILSDADDGVDVVNTGEQVLMLSPGLKFTWSSLILEGLVQMPVWQNQEGLQTERQTGFLLGFRLMN